MSTLYGSDAISGVINIITRKVGTRWGCSAGLETTVQEHAEFGDLHGANFHLDGPLIRDLLGLSVRGGWFRRDEAALAYLEADGDEVAPRMGANPVRQDSHNAAARLSLVPGDRKSTRLNSSH